MTAWDDEGRPSEWVTVTESEWDAEDRAIVGALLDIKSDTCDGCGQRLSESLAVRGEPLPEWEHPFLVCTGCVSKDRELAVLEKKDAVLEKAGGFVSRMSRKFITRRKQLKTK